MRVCFLVFVSYKVCFGFCLLIQASAIDVAFPLFSHTFFVLLNFIPEDEVNYPSSYVDDVLQQAQK